MGQEPLRPLTGSHQRALGVAADRYAENVIEAWDWLGARGIRTATAATHRLGVVTDPIAGHEPHVGRLSIPYLDAKGNVTQIRFRCLMQHDCAESLHGKYMTSAGDEARLYNVKALTTPGDELHVTEGEFDALILQQLGLPAVGCPGVATWAYRHTIAARNFNAVYVWGDGDRAGRDFNTKLYSELPNARIVTLPDGDDITSVFVKGGQEAVEALLWASCDLYGASE